MLRIIFRGNDHFLQFECNVANNNLNVYDEFWKKKVFFFHSIAKKIREFDELYFFVFSFMIVYLKIGLT